MQRLADTLDRLGHFPAVRADLEALRREMDTIAVDAPHASLVRWWLATADSGDRYTPVSLMPILHGAGISQGIAVGWHSASPSVTWPGAEHHDRRLLAGRLIHDVKTYDIARWEAYPEDIQRIGALAACALASTVLPAEPDLIVSVPSSRGSNAVPQAIARDVGFLTRTRVSPPGTVRFTRPLAQVKEMVDYWRKSELLAGALATERSSVAGRNIIIIDDVCRSGATLSECARSCLEAGASTVTVLAISKTWRFQRIPDRSSEPGLEAPADWEAVGW